MALKFIRYRNFCYCFSLQSGVVLTIVVFAVLFFLVFVMNIFSITVSHRWSQEYLGGLGFFFTHAIVILFGVFFAFLGAYREEHKMMVIAAMLVFIGFLVYLVASIMSYYPGTYKMTCILHRCPDHIWSEDSYWRVFFFEGKIHAKMREKWYPENWEEEDEDEKQVSTKQKNEDTFDYKELDLGRNPNWRCNWVAPGTREVISQDQNFPMIHPRDESRNPSGIGAALGPVLSPVISSLPNMSSNPEQSLQVWPKEPDYPRSPIHDSDLKHSDGQEQAHSSGMKSPSWQSRNPILGNVLPEPDRDDEIDLGLKEMLVPKLTYPTRPGRKVKNWEYTTGTDQIVKMEQSHPDWHKVSAEEAIKNSDFGIGLKDKVSSIKTQPPDSRRKNASSALGSKSKQIVEVEQTQPVWSKESAEEEKKNSVLGIGLNDKVRSVKTQLQDSRRKNASSVLGNAPKQIVKVEQTQPVLTKELEKEATKKSVVGIEMEEVTNLGKTQTPDLRRQGVNSEFAKVSEQIAEIEKTEPDWQTDSSEAAMKRLVFGDGLNEIAGPEKSQSSDPWMHTRSSDSPFAFEVKRNKIELNQLSPNRKEELNSDKEYVYSTTQGAADYSMYQDNIQTLADSDDLFIQNPKSDETYPPIRMPYLTLAISVIFNLLYLAFLFYTVLSYIAFSNELQSPDFESDYLKWLKLRGLVP